MRFSEKLTRLTADENKAKIARAAGLPPNAINDYINKGYTPRVDNALALSKALKISFEWLVDDSQDWPPPTGMGSASPSQFSDQELMFELAKRWRRSVVDLLNAFDQAVETNWKEIRSQLGKWNGQEPLPEKLDSIKQLLHKVVALNYIASQYEVARFAAKNHSQMPGSDRPADDFEAVSIEVRKKAALDAMKACPELSRLKPADAIFDIFSTKMIK